MSREDVLSFQLARERVLRIEAQAQALQLELTIRRQHLEQAVDHLRKTYALSATDEFNPESGAITRKGPAHEMDNVAASS